MSQPKVTILLPVYNGAETLARAIHSIINQTYSDWQLLILEDGSNDATLSIAQSFKDKRIKIVSDGLHLGIVSRLNQGIQLTDTPYIARMDADDVSYPERLEKQIAFLDENPTIDLVGTAIRVVNKDGKLIRQHIFPTCHHQIVSQPWLKSISVAHPTWCGRANWFKYWQYRDYLRNEDQELLLRAHSKSAYANLPDILLDYFETPSSSKKLSARWGWITVLWSFYGTKGRIFPFLGGILISTAKLFRDFLKKHSL
jgi:glycosyltransferase involved in cell wall biosynthesis